MADKSLTRRGALGLGAGLAAFAAMPRSWAQSFQSQPSGPQTFDLALEHRTVNITGTPRPAMAINGAIPAPALRFREGEEVIVNVANRLREDALVHWHGLTLPSGQDGVPGISSGFQGIPAPRNSPASTARSSSSRRRATRATTTTTAAPSPRWCAT